MRYKCRVEIETKMRAHLLPSILLLRRYRNDLNPFLQNHLVVFRNFVRKHRTVLGQFAIDFAFNFLLYRVGGGRRFISTNSGEGVEVSELIRKTNRIVKRILAGAVLGLVERFLHNGQKLDDGFAEVIQLRAGVFW